MKYPSIGNIFSRIVLGTLLLILSQHAQAFQIKDVIFNFRKTNEVKVIVSPTETVTGSLGDLDLLFVVDDSGSMAEHQKILSASAPGLSTKLAAFSSLHVGVTTTTTDGTTTTGDGKLIGTPTVLSPDQSTFATDLANRFVVGNNGSGTETLFAPVMAALSSPLLDGANAGFLRPQAHLAVVFVTDAEDQSQQTPEEFVNFLTQLKGANHFSLTSFMAPSGNTKCNRDDSYAPPIRLEKAINLAHGAIHNICDGDYANKLDSIVGQVERTLAKTIRLPFTPEFNSIAVKYGTVTLAPGDLHNGWIYDSIENSVVLGDLIDVNNMPPGDLEITFIKK